MRALIYTAHGETVTVSNTEPTTILGSLLYANYVQAFIKSAEQLQPFTVTLLDYSTVFVPEGGGWEMDVDALMCTGHEAFKLQTAESPADFQILFMMKRVK